MLPLGARARKSFSLFLSSPFAAAAITVANAVFAGIAVASVAVFVAIPMIADVIVAVAAIAAVTPTWLPTPPP